MERTAELASTNAELDAFAYSVAHDLRAPLRTMRQFSEVIQEDYAKDLPEDARRLVARIGDAAAYMDDLIQDLLSYSKLTRAEIVFRPVGLDRVVSEVLQQLEGEISGRGAQVAVGASLPVVRAHRSTLGQVVANLVANGLKFVPEGVTPLLRLWAEKRNGTVRLWVEDNGIGIEPEHQERIFRAFERLHTMERYPGTGIGLAIVRKGMERMGGAVGVESEPGKGSRFWIELQGEGEPAEP